MHYIRPLWDRKQKPYIGRIKHGTEITLVDGSRKRRKLEYIYYLKPYGVETVKENPHIFGDEWIKYPKSGKAGFTKDYWHRKLTVSSLIQLDHDCDMNELNVDSMVTYFDTKRSTDNPSIYNQQKFTVGDSYLYPDSILRLSNDVESFLFCLELHNLRKTKDIVEQIHKHARAISTGIISDAYGIKKSYKLLNVFADEKKMDIVVNRLLDDYDLRYMSELMLFKTMDKLTIDFFRCWSNLNGESVNCLG